LPSGEGRPTAPCMKSNAYLFTIYAVAYLIYLPGLNAQDFLISDVQIGSSATITYQSDLRSSFVLLLGRIVTSIYTPFSTNPPQSGPATFTVELALNRPEAAFYRVQRLTPPRGANAGLWIGAGSGHSAALRRDGTLWVWGSSQAYTLGDGSSFRKQPTQILPNKTWKAVSVGLEHTAAIAADGKLWTWGRNTEGEVGDEIQDPKVDPSPVKFAGPWASVSCGFQSTLAILKD
jgi:hypothetical protein